MFGRRDNKTSGQGPNELPIPPQAALGKEAIEVFRAFIVDGGLQVSLQRGFDDPQVWGVLLADVARHASRIYAAEGVTTEAVALAAMRKLFDAELDRPTEIGTTHQTN